MTALVSEFLFHIPEIDVVRDSLCARTARLEEDVVGRSEAPVFSPPDPSMATVLKVDHTALEDAEVTGVDKPGMLKKHFCFFCIFFTF